MRTKSLILVFITLLTCMASNAIYANSHHPPITINGVYKFSGKLNGKIPIFLWFFVQDSVLKGEVTYLKTANRIPIPIVGTIAKDGTYDFFEFTTKGYITGIYDCKTTGNNFTGTWGAPHTEKQLTCILTPKDTILTVAGNYLKPTAIDGEYLYYYGKNGGAGGGIYIKRLDGDKVSFDANCVTSAPANNVADIETTTLKMTGNNTIIYKVPDSDCKFRIRVFKDFVVIDRLTPDLMDCGFGLNATIEGVFFKTSSVPNFVQR